MVSVTEWEDNGVLITLLHQLEPALTMLLRCCLINNFIIADVDTHLKTHLFVLMDHILCDMNGSSSYQHISSQGSCLVTDHTDGRTNKQNCQTLQWSTLIINVTFISKSKWLSACNTVKTTLSMKLFFLLFFFSFDKKRCLMLFYTLQQNASSFPSVVSLSYHKFKAVWLPVVCTWRIIQMFVEANLLFPADRVELKAQRTHRGRVGTKILRATRRDSLRSLRAGNDSRHFKACAPRAGNL